MHCLPRPPGKGRGYPIVIGNPAWIRLTPNTDMYLGGTSWVNSLLGFLALRIGRLFRRDILFFLLFVVVDEIVIIFVVGHGCG